MKKPVNILALVFIFSFVLLGGNAFAQEWMQGTVGGTYRLAGYHTFEASWWIGYRVMDNQAGYLGQISSLVIDNTNGRVALVVLSDVPNLGHKHLAIPYSSIVRTGEYSFEFNPGRMVIQAARSGVGANSDSYIYSVTLGPSDSEFFGIPSKITPTWVSDIYRHYGQEPYWTEKGEQPLRELDLYPSTRLMGAEVQTPKGEAVAQINDLVIDSHGGHIAFVVLSNVAGRGDTLVAVPFGSLSSRGQNVFVLNATEKQLTSAPSFNELANMNNGRYAENVYKYFGQHPYWTEGETLVSPNGQ